MKRFVIGILLVLGLTNSGVAAPVMHSKIGDSKTTEGKELTIKCVDQRRGFGSGDTYDPDINSPKSATFSRDGKKVYVNSLEGCKTVVYDVATRKKLKTIEHKFDSGEGPLWNQPSGYYTFTHYPDGATRSFRGKPVEEALTPDGRYMFVPYYRRDFDLNAQDPSALAVIDTKTDEIVRMIETGPLPKMVRVSHDGKLLAITHWGDNTVGLLDISDKNPANWKHRQPVVIGNKLNLNYSLSRAVNRDSGSGFLLRGTVFLPGDSLLLVSGMAGPLNVIDVKSGQWIGTFPAFSNVRHLTLHNDLLYMSRNSAGEVMTVPVENIVKAIKEGRASGSRQFKASGARSVKVGGGARTLKVSPSGKYIFVACNSSSAVYIVSTEDMKVIGSITADSFPVGLDVSPDGSMVVTTSQGVRGSGGGNAVNFFEVDYSTPEPAPVIEEIATDDEEGAAAQTGLQTDNSDEGESTSTFWILLWSVIGAIVLAAVILLLVRRGKSNR